MDASSTVSLATHCQLILGPLKKKIQRFVWTKEGRSKEKRKRAEVPRCRRRLTLLFFFVCLLEQTLHLPPCCLFSICCQDVYHKVRAQVLCGVWCVLRACVLACCRRFFLFNSHIAGRSTRKLDNTCTRYTHPCARVQCAQRTYT